MLQRVIQSSGD
uniref:Uncharacterized protein n=1 Tax=Rhizophora mucronata TaxID=61149 RepID=A0A2P2NHM0_RHIMU